MVVINCCGGSSHLAVIREDIYVEPPLVLIDGQRNFNMASSSDVL